MKNTLQPEDGRIEQVRDHDGEGAEAADAATACAADGSEPKQAKLRRVADRLGIPFIEYDETLAIPPDVAEKLDLELLKREGWFPLSVRDGVARVVTSAPGDAALKARIREALGVSRLDLIYALPSDVIRLVENQQDVNPGFPPSASRTTLARLRTWLAGQRVFLAGYRTLLAQGRTGLALIRTGVSLISISLVLFRLFGLGYLSILEGVLLVIGLLMAVDGFTWYLPARRIARKPIDYMVTEPTFGTTVLEMRGEGEERSFVRSPPVPGAEELRAGWNRLTPVMRRRFLAIDRTDLAEERTLLAGYRTLLARARTGLAFARTGTAFIGLGVALLRQFGTGPWTAFDAVLLLMGVVMAVEGLQWYFRGRAAGKKSHEAVGKAEQRMSIWDFMFGRHRRELATGDLPSALTIGSRQAPGIWGTTGLALERTLIADRRNAKARLRTVMGRSRTGLSFIRTGTSIFSVGLGLMIFFGTGNLYWDAFNVCLMLIGFVLMLDGTWWHFPADRIRRQFPYCFNEMEITFPDYGEPSLNWKRIVFSHEDLK